MKIGVILRKVNDRFTLNEELERVISYYNASVVGITSFDLDLLNYVDGFILQGGFDYTELDLKITSYLYEHDIPTLGICLGMQTMGVMKQGVLKELKTEKHYSLDKRMVHDVKIDTNSKFYDIIKKDKISVNSRHHEALEKTNLSIVGYSDDGVVEVIEDASKKFFIGVQWHPETNFFKDEISKKLFDYYFQILSR